MIRNFNGKSPKIHCSAFVSEAAYVSGDIEIGENSSVWPGAVIRGDFGKIAIGDNSIIEDNCVIHSGTDVVIGNNVIIGHGAVVHGQLIGNHTLVGNNATILDGTEIGNFCIVGAGSVILPKTKIPDNSLIMGSPARIKGKLYQKQLDKLKNGSALYAELAQKYKQEGL